jgi:hypothetical protein
VKKVEAADIRNIAEYEKVREAMRAAVIALKKDRRVSLGDNLTLLFENRETVVFQIHEMMRAERIVHDDQVQAEIDVYNQLIPDPGQLSATLFIEIPDLAKMAQDEVRVAVNRFQGLDEGGLFLRLGEHALPARFEGGHSKEEKMAAVHYLRFDVPEAARAALADPGQPAELLVEHPRYQARSALPPGVRAQLLADLR